MFKRTSVLRAKAKRVLDAKSKSWVVRQSDKSKGRSSNNKQTLDDSSQNNSEVHPEQTKLGDSYKSALAVAELNTDDKAIKWAVYNLALFYYESGQYTEFLRACTQRYLNILASPEVEIKVADTLLHKLPVGPKGEPRNYSQELARIKRAIWHFGRALLLIATQENAREVVDAQQEASIHLAVAKACVAGYETVTAMGVKDSEFENSNSIGMFEMAKQSGIPSKLSFLRHAQQQYLLALGVAAARIEVCNPQESDGEDSDPESPPSRRPNQFQDVKQKLGVVLAREVSTLEAILETSLLGTVMTMLSQPNVSNLDEQLVRVLSRIANEHRESSIVDENQSIVEDFVSQRHICFALLDYSKVIGNLSNQDPARVVADSSPGMHKVVGIVNAGRQRDQVMFNAVAEDATNSSFVEVETDPLVEARYLELQVWAETEWKREILKLDPNIVFSIEEATPLENMENSNTRKKSFRSNVVAQHKVRVGRKSVSFHSDLKRVKQQQVLRHEAQRKVLVEAYCAHGLISIMVLRAQLESIIETKYRTSRQERAKPLSDRRKVPFFVEACLEYPETKSGKLTRTRRGHCKAQLCDVSGVVVWRQSAQSALIQLAFTGCKAPWKTASSTPGKEHHVRNRNPARTAFGGGNKLGLDVITETKTKEKIKEPNAVLDETPDPVVVIAVREKTWHPNCPLVAVGRLPLTSYLFVRNKVSSVQVDLYPPNTPSAQMKGSEMVVGSVLFRIGVSASTEKV